MSSIIPDSIFNRFSDNTRKILIQAQQLSAGMGKPLSSEHIVLSLSMSRGTLAYDILKENLITPDQIRLIIGLQFSPTVKQSYGFNDEVRKILKKSILLAARYRYPSVDPEHLLLASLSDSTFHSYKTVQDTGIDPQLIIRQIEDLFGDLAEMDELIKQKSKEYTKANVRSGKIASRQSLINYFTTDLTSLAKQGKLDQVIGRSDELNRAIRILNRRTKNNPIFIGEPGVGKTSIVEGIAQMIASGTTTPKLNNYRILSLDLALLVAGTMYRGQFEERIKKLVDEIKRQKNIIIFIDEIHLLVGAGSAEGSMDAANILKPALTKNKIRIIGATTINEYRKYIEKDAALDRRLQPILVQPTNYDDTVKILKGIRIHYEKYHHIKILNDTLESAIRLSDRYINDRFQPDKAIDVLDEASALVSISGYKEPKTKAKIDKLTIQLKTAIDDKLKLVNEEKYDEANNIKKLESEISNQINKLKQSGQEDTPSYGTVTKEHISKIISDWTGIPVSNISADDNIKFINLEKKLSNHIIAQDEAISEIASALRRSHSGISDPKRPIGSFIFLGPTGVGKTELTKVLAREVFNDEKALLKVDMSEFMEKHNVSRLVGAPPGYVGYEESGKLTEFVRRRPYSVILFDEIEKAHPEVFNLLLQIMEDGQLTDGQGRTVSFRNTIIILTSNIGIKDFQLNGIIGFKSSTGVTQYEELQHFIVNSLKDQMSPEFINRLDRIVVFKPLDDQALIRIATLELSKLCVRIKQSQNIKLSFSPEVAKYIVKIGTDSQYGARPIRRAIQTHIENILSSTILSDQQLSSIHITISDSKPSIEIKRKVLKN